MDLESYAPFFISTIANRWTSTSSRIYVSRFGIGVAEWRVLAALSVFGQATSLDIVNLISMDPAAVSRAMRNLAGGGHVARVEGRFRGRNKPFAMTPCGEILFTKIQAVALDRQNILLKTLDKDERAAFIAILRKVYANLGEL
jgi:DNA-binding MarR family transcriptional regulator